MSGFLLSTSVGIQFWQKFALCGSLFSEHLLRSYPGKTFQVLCILYLAILYVLLSFDKKNEFYINFYFQFVCHYHELQSTAPVFH